MNTQTNNKSEYGEVDMGSIMTSEEVRIIYIYRNICLSPTGSFSLENPNRYRSFNKNAKVGPESSVYLKKSKVRKQLRLWKTQAWIKQ